MNKTYNRMFNLVVNSNRTDEIAMNKPLTKPVATDDVSKGGARKKFGLADDENTVGGARVLAPGTNKGGAPTVNGGVDPTATTPGGALKSNPGTNTGGARERWGRITNRNGQLTAGGRKL